MSINLTSQEGMCSQSLDSRYNRMKITLVGHSQVPCLGEDFEGNIITTYKKGGANLWDLDNKFSPLYPALRERTDVLVLFLGGNDVFLKNGPNQFVEPKVIKEKLRSVIIQARRVASRVLVCLLEDRDYSQSRNPVWAANAEYYTRTAKQINNSLNRRAKFLGYRCIHLGRHEFAARKADGVHFSKAAGTRVGHKILSAIRYC